MSFLSRTSLLLAAFFALDKGLAILRQVIIARQFGLSAELDAFNAANNVPDLLFALISGGALAMAFIPVLAQVLTKDGRKASWQLFSRIANLAFLVTGALALVFAAFAGPIVRNVVTPGFNPSQQALVVELMRLNLIATIIFSLSGLVMAGLQSNQHFLLPAMAPLLYNTGQIFGALILAPTKGYSFAGITLPAFGLGVQGLVYGVILGAVLHLGIQIPGLIVFKFRWTPGLALNDPDVRKVLRLLLPRLIAIFSYQLVFMIRDYLASYLQTGSVSALTYGYMVYQVPETLIGTAIGTALLPTLAQHYANGDWETFSKTIERAIQVMLALTLPAAMIMSLGLRPLLVFGFHLDSAGTDLLMWVSRGFLVGLLGECLYEVASRSFYAQQNAITPLIASGVNIVVYTLSAALLYRRFGAPGISLSVSIGITAQAMLLLTILIRKRPLRLTIRPTLTRVAVGVVCAGAVMYAVLLTQLEGPTVLIAGFIMALGAACVLPFIWPEIRVLFRL